MIKKILASFTIGSLFLALVSFSAAPRIATAAEINLINNPSTEEIESGGLQPVGWLNNSWGENTAKFRLATSCYEGKKCVRTDVSNYQSGDAKWYFEKVAVSGGQSYNFSDYYKSNVATEIVIELSDSLGNVSYQWLGTVPKKTAWTKAAFEFKIPAETTHLSIFHLIAKNGYLITDKYLLQGASSSVVANNVPNNSLEQSSFTGNIPLSWQKSKWGTNNTSFGYLNTGHIGNRSIKTTITSYTDGDAKWYFEPQVLDGGKTYQFSDYYKSDITSRVVLMLNKIDGTTAYQELKNAPASAGWSNYTDVFTVPIGVSSASVFHLIAAAGFLITDDYSIKPYQPAGFARPIVSLTFDDGWEDNYTSVLPLLNQYGFRSTQYYATTFIENNPAQQYKVAGFVSAGHEIGAHSVTHPDLTKLTDANLEAELRNSQALLETFAGAGNVKAFATPFGAYDSRVIAAILSYYQSHRSTDAGFNTRDGITATNVRVQNILSTTTVVEYQSWLDQAARDKSWLVLVYHRVADNPGAYDTYSADFALQMAAVANSGIAVLPVSESLAELQPQI